MGFIDIEQADFPSANPLKQLLQLFDKGGSTLRVGFPKHLLAFLPTQSLSPQDSVQGGAAACVADDLFKPAPQFLQSPGMTRQAVVDRVGVDDRVSELVELLLVKRGERPPV